jgi:hypothetical protein
MTLRALIIGIIGAIVFAAGGRYVNAYIPGPNMVRGHMPISVFGLLILSAIGINPLLGWVRKSWSLKPSELALMLALLLGVSTIIDAGLMRHYPTILMWGMHAERTQPGWQKVHVVGYVPPVMMANGGKYSEEVVDNYMSEGDPIAWPTPWYKPWQWEMGKFEKTLKASWDRVPWAVWWKPLAFWGVIVALSYTATIGLSVLVHRQWARRERIRYPIAEIISSLLVQDENGRTTMLHNKLFWLGLGTAMFISMLNMIMLWYPNSVNIPLKYDFSVLYTAWPQFMKTQGMNYVANAQLYPAAMGIAFLLASDIGFGLGISNILTALTLYFLLQIGVDTASGGATEGGVVPFLNFGAYVAYTLMLIYIGRLYYWRTTKEAITFVRQPETDTAATWGLRVCILSVSAIIVILICAGMPWHVALFSISLTMMMYVVLARLDAEAGTFFCQPSWSFSMALLCVYGFGALGPAVYLGMNFVRHILAAGSFECLMPYAVNGLKVTTDTGLKVGRVGVVIAVTVIVAMCVTVFVGVWSSYQNPVGPTAGKDTVAMYDMAQRQIMKLQLAGELDASNNYTSWERLKHMNVDRRFLAWSAAGMLLAFGLSAARLRWPWWPLHPIILLTFGSVLMVGRYGISLFVGWFLKVFILRIAGPTAYASARQFMIGVIAGDILGGFMTMLALWGYYLFTGTKGPSWQFW